MRPSKTLTLITSPIEDFPAGTLPRKIPECAIFPGRLLKKPSKGSVPVYPGSKEHAKPLLVVKWRKPNVVLVSECGVLKEFTILDGKCYSRRIC